MIITLEFPIDTTVLVGFGNGKKTYDKQIKDKVDLSVGMNVIVIPASINNISISFVQGFAIDINKESFYDHNSIKACDMVTKKFSRALFF